MRASLIPLLPTLLFSTASLVSVPAWAAATPSSASTTQSSGTVTTHVLGFTTNDYYEQAQAVTKAIKQVISSSTNARLGEGDFSLEVLTAALGCSDVPDPSCLKKIATKTQSRRFIWGTISLEGQRIIAQIHLYDESGTSKSAQFSYPTTVTDSTDADLVEFAARAVSDLLPPLTYKVLVRAEQKEGQILVDGKVAGSLSNGETTIVTTSGKHVFRLEVPNQPPVEETERVRADGTTKVQLNLSTSPLTPGTSTLTASATKTEQLLTEPPMVASTGGGNAQRTWGYVTLGAGGVFLAAGGLAAGRLYMLNDDDGYRNYREGLTSSQDACKEAKRNHVVDVDGASSPADVRSICDEADTMEILQYAFLAASVVAAGTGITLLLTSKSSKKAAVTRFEPRVTVGKDRTNIGVFVRF